MNVVLLICVVVGAMPPSQERIKELVKKLEEQTRHDLEKMGPPNGIASNFNYRFHWPILAELKRGGDSAIPAILTVLEDKSKPGQVRAQLATVLLDRLVGTKIKSDPKIIAAVNAALKEKNPALRWGVLDYLPRYSLARNLAQWDMWKKIAVESELQKLPPVEFDARDVLRRFPPPEERSFPPEVTDAFLPQVIAALADDQPEIVTRAADTLSTFGPKLGIPELLAALKRKEPDVRRAVVGALGVVGKDNPDVFQALLEQFRLKDTKEHPQLYISLIAAIGSFGREAKVIVPQLIEAVNDNLANDQRDLRSYHDVVVRALGNIGPDAKAAIPTLLECLDKKYYAGDSKTAYYQGSREDILIALDRIDSDVGRKARVIEKQKHNEYLRWYEELSLPRPPIIVEPPVPRP